MKAHMIIIRTTAAKIGAVAFILAGLFGVFKAGEVMFIDAVTQGVEAAQEPDDWAGECLDFARQRGIDVGYCEPFVNPQDAPPMIQALDADQVALIAEGFTYDAGTQGTTVYMPDGSILYVPVQRDACPLLTVYDTDRQWCINWADLTPGEDNG